MLKVGVDLGLQVVEPACLELVGLHLLLIDNLLDGHQGQLGGLSESRGYLGLGFEELGRLHRGVLHQSISLEEFHQLILEAGRDQRGGRGVA